jgi:isoleucyl-tRNA synthetase
LSTDYKTTLNLPQTDFSMRADLANREPAKVQQWIEAGVYQQMIARRKAAGAPTYLLHDGPPYANGNIHHGHILNKTLKDFVVKYRNMSGNVCEFVPGWDCHGLPIEHQVDKNLGPKKRDMTQVEIRQECREYARTWVGKQRDEFRRIMVFADWENPYLTMDYSYEAKTVRELGRIFERGLAYRGLKPVHWDWAARTALAEAEVEYQSFTTHHVYVKFPFTQLPDDLKAAVGADDKVFVVIWTTTPWTLPANLAIALNPDMDYQLVRVGDEVYVMAEGLRASVLKECKLDPEACETLATFPGSALVGELGESRGLAARHPWLDRDSVLLPADYVTLDQGTGCVHTAPGHGQEDFVLGQHYNIGVINPVGDDGRYREYDLPEFAGVHVFEANPLIAQKLADLGLLLNQPTDKVTIDRYPHGWRSKKPVIFRATTQWFIAMEPENAGNPEGYKLREAALEAIEQVKWLPSWGRDRIHGMVVGRPDWCISRQRLWGVPITVMYCARCDQALATRAIADHVADLVEQEGVDVWFTRTAKELVPHGTTCPGCGHDDFTKETDILDVWFDSGVSWSAVLETKLGHTDPQADLYLEGSDQHRGWFQSSMLCGLASRGRVPYKTCLTHGFVVDENGNKYSKSSKNFEPPEKMLKTHGAEVLRFWVAAVDYRNDITLSGEILNRVGDAYRKVRNTFRFLHSNLDGFNPNTDQVALADLEPMDKWALTKTGEAIERIQRGYEECQFHQIYHALVELATVHLSSVYMDVTKDRMYCEAPTGHARRSGQTAYWLILDALVRASAPILTFTTQEIWELMGKIEGAPEYVFWADFPEEALGWRELADAMEWEALLGAREVVQKALEAKRGRGKDKQPGQIGSSQEASVTLEMGEHEAVLKRNEALLPSLFIVSQVKLVPAATLAAEVEPSTGEKCPRCWNYWAVAGSGVETCARCAEVLAARS